MRERRGYYSWTDPSDGVEYGLGRDRLDAIDQVTEARIKFGETNPAPRLVDRIGGEEVRTWGKWCDEFQKLLGERENKHNTKQARKSQMKRLRAVFPAVKLAAKIDTADCAKVIGVLKTAGKHRTAQAFRTFLIDCFDRMIAQGWRPDNPARVLDTVTVKVKRARLTLDVFMTVYRATENVRLRNAMALAIVSGQARESVAGARFADFHDGAWWHERGKTGARIVLPLDIRLDCFGMSLADVVRQCRGTGVLSKHLIHQIGSGQNRIPGRHTHVETLTRDFSDEITNLRVNWGDKKAPTFHEIRSLAERLHREQGDVNTQELLGHKDAKTTATYHDGRGEWVKVAVRKTTV